MGVGKDHPLFRHLIEVGSGNLAVGIQAANIAVSQVVAEDDDDIRPFRRRDLIAVNREAEQREQIGRQQNCFSWSKTQHAVAHNRKKLLQKPISLDVALV